MNKKSSNIVIVSLSVVIIVLGVLLFMKSAKAPATLTEVQTQSTPKTTPITITKENINEDNFTGTKPVITGSGILADAARTYIDQTVATFKETADQDVPALHAKFGNDIASDKYEIDIKATYTKAAKTDSIIIEDYEYTGGANGNSLYKVITASNATGQILTLADVIKTDQQAAFTAYVKNQLLVWKPDGSDQPVVFGDAVGGLTFDSFDNWSFDKTNLIIYFDKYAIGPGALGAVAFPLSHAKIQQYLNTGY
jgi:hypothetical protein